MTTNIENKHLAAAGGGVGLLAAYLLLEDDVPAALEGAQTDVQSVVDRVQEVSENGELVVDPVTGVFYDDPETGPLDDEEEDDWNVSFEAANELLAEAGEYIDPETYAPDTQDGSTSTSTGVLADAGDSQNWGDAGEQENDDLTERTAESNLSDDQKSMWDRLANYDSAEEMEADNWGGSGEDYSAPDDALSFDHSDSDQVEIHDQYVAGELTREEVETELETLEDSDDSTSSSSTDDTDTTTSSYDDVGSWGSDDSDDEEEDDGTNYYDNYYDQGGSTGSTFI